MITYKGDKYALIFDELPVPKIEWLGHFSEESPYVKDRKSDTPA